MSKILSIQLKKIGSISLKKKYSKLIHSDKIKNVFNFEFAKTLARNIIFMFYLLFFNIGIISL